MRVRAAQTITDGHDDNGVDAIHRDAGYLVQSKWIHSGTGEPENGDIKSLWARFATCSICRSSVSTTMFTLDPDFGREDRAWHHPPASGRGRVFVRVNGLQPERDLRNSTAIRARQLCDASSRQHFRSAPAGSALLEWFQIRVGRQQEFQPSLHCDLGPSSCRRTDCAFCNGHRLEKTILR